VPGAEATELVTVPSKVSVMNPGPPTITTWVGAPLLDATGEIASKGRAAAARSKKRIPILTSGR
jgi:hypothetical protein